MEEIVKELIEIVGEISKTLPYPDNASMEKRIKNLKDKLSTPEAKESE